LASTYKIEGLAEICVDLMLQKISDLNSVNFFLTAHRYNSTKLLLVSKDFIARYFSEVQHTRGWKSLHEEQNAIAFDHLTEFMWKHYDSSRRRDLID
jgi:hypothetical protein